MRKKKEPVLTHVNLYEGPSLLGNGAEIVVLAIKVSENDKTGNMIQTYILNKHVPPITAQKTQQDDVNCGDCKHRNTSCYVRVETGVNGVYRSYTKGNYKKLTETEAIEWFRGTKVRMGTYGDPAAINPQQWRIWLQNAQENTGYTHQWKTTDLKDLCMASTDNIEEYWAAKSLGWRVFHVKNNNDEKPIPKAIGCPASEEMGKKLQCIDCLMCNGTQKGATSDIVINAHGAQYKVRKFRELSMVGQ
jgi:hypothetical protein